MAPNNHLWSNEKRGSRKVDGIHEVDGMSMINVKLDVLTKRIDQMSMNVVSTQVVSCERVVEEMHMSNANRG
ncbi:conserved hypothetical protein [Ricinus communis]|uniref:Uncharacterized protein n=1 Tax=Ricinus communis TaxID=3988 RepID=B9T3K5_RICCO|nr:conserved hypothetical protein [Ricinus communis]